jgi:hypothetical protein
VPAADAKRLVRAIRNADDVLFETYLKHKGVASSKMQGHGFGIGGRQDQAGGDAAFGAGGSEQIGRVVALIAWRAGPASSLGRDVGQRALLANARLVLKPDFDRLAGGTVGEPLRDRCGKVFLNASWASASARG